jgi:hypothetical protein
MSLRLCGHPKPDGLPCGSPALRGQPFPPGSCGPPPESRLIPCLLRPPGGLGKPTRHAPSLDYTQTRNLVIAS